MPSGACCKNDKVCGEGILTCCSDTEVCVNKTTCCPSDKANLDASGNCVQCTDDCHCADGQTCDSATGKCEKCPEITGCLAYGDECKCLQCSGEYTLTNGKCAGDCASIGELIQLDKISFCSVDFISHEAGIKKCQKIGMSLPSVYDICPNWNGKEGKTCSGSLIKE